MRPPRTRRDPVPLMWDHCPVFHVQVSKEVQVTGFIFLAAALLTTYLSLKAVSQPQPDYPHKFIITFTKEN